MLDLASVHRTQYQPTGKVHTASLLFGMVVLFTTSCMAGVALSVLYMLTLLLQIVPGLLALILVSTTISVLVGKVVEFSHCRSPRLGMFLGLLCGSLTFLSSYHAAEVTARWQAGGVLSEEISRVDRLPDIIGQRLYAPTANRPADDYSQFNPMRTMLVLCEFGILVWLSSKTGHDAGSRAYDEASGRWFKRSLVRAVAGSGEKIVDALKLNPDLTDPSRYVPMNRGRPSRHSSVSDFEKMIQVDRPG